VSLREHLESLRAADDRRYAEVNVEREKALKIKETADLAALQLAREIQTYKDEKANELRSQIESERGNYATKDDLTAAVREISAATKPAVDYVTAQAGRREGSEDRRQGVGMIVAVVGVCATVAGLGAGLLVTMAGG